ncbi:alpha/beta fold hydrolase [Candidatus Cyanaurora vandensis]|uniref:alpha/beta fold hydrolase n=1 Tax=Candidatus Cyanaurora vandensis TaxID=2714958 RepID=UPI00257C47C0|nr:alpha/beta fold hydrolase [Candidatus Cyanaurora vandensis]
MALTLPRPTVTPAQNWTWQGHHIHYLQAGLEHSGTPILLIHGCGVSSSHWQKNITELALHRPVFALDLLGFGRSAKPNLVYNGELWRDQLREFCEQIIGGPAVVVGHSLGGYAALILAADYPEWVEGLVLVNSAGFFAEDYCPDSWKQFFAQIGKNMCRHPVVSRLLFHLMRQPSFIRRTLLKVYHDPSAVTEQLVEDIHRPSCEPGAFQVFRSAFQADPSRYADALLAQLRRPLLLLWGEWDPLLALSRGEQFRTAYPQAQLFTIPAGHCPHDERPELVNRYLLEWLPRV